MDELTRHISGEAPPPVRPRPPIFRALGLSDPPQTVEIGGEISTQVRVFKHDSWAATALYEHPSRGLVVCKFNRVQRVGPIPMRWLGRYLARTESTALRRLEATGLVPQCLGGVHVEGQLQPNIVARRHIAGHPIGAREKLPAEFFDSLRTLLDEVHRLRMAYVDLHKRENVLVGDDGRPYLIDFQISYIPAGWALYLPTTRLKLAMLQQSDDYHFEKLRRKHCQGADSRVPMAIPWWIRLHRMLAVPFRQFRRRFLVGLRVRSGEGHADSEVFTEEALRREDRGQQ